MEHAAQEQQDDRLSGKNTAAACDRALFPEWFRVARWSRLSKNAARDAGRPNRIDVKPKLRVCIVVCGVRGPGIARAARGVKLRGKTNAFHTCHSLIQLRTWRYSRARATYCRPWRPQRNP